MAIPKQPSGVGTCSDALYHQLFTHPVMVEQLVREFVPEAMAVGLDFARMEMAPTKFHSRRGKRREGDVIWRIPTSGGGDVLLHLLFEFQSRVDWWMSVRSQVYTGLLWQAIIKERKLKPGDLLPPVLTIVVYNGDRRWDAPNDVSQLIALPPDSPLWPWQPRVRYYLLDEGAFPNDELARRGTLTSLLFRLEHCHQVDDLVGLVDEVVGWFRQHLGHDTLRHLFTEIVAQAAHQVEGKGDVEIPEDLLEVRSMLATRAQEWKRQLLAEGRAEGEAEMLLRLLRRRFALAPEMEARIRQADSRQIADWGERFADGKSLTEIFGSDHAH